MMDANASNQQVHRKVVWGRRAKAALALLSVALLPSCSEAIRTGQGSSYLVITSLVGQAGGGGDAPDVNLDSDVLTVVNGSPTIFGDTGSATFQLVMKDTLNEPTANNAITLTQYHVQYIRSDGRNTQGIDVPYAFDGGMAVTVSGTATAGFMLVRNQAKTEAPLAALASNGQIISTIAEVTFYGQDQTGRAVSVKGRIDINFANWGD
jgi:hypothetical protein